MLMITLGILIPLFGTTIGAIFAFFVKTVRDGFKRAVFGFAAGVMVAASVWSLLIPSIEFATEKYYNPLIMPLLGLLSGFGSLMLFDWLTQLKAKPCYDDFDDCGIQVSEGKTAEKACLAEKSALKKLVFAVTLHNIPEGMAVGVLFAATIDNSVALTAAFALAIGVAIQNIPEGAIISLPLCSDHSKFKSAYYGFISGVVEPIAAVITLALTALIGAILPFALAFAAGAMLYVVADELLPNAKQGGAFIGTIGFSLGFAIMMTLDVLLG